MAKKTKVKKIKKIKKVKLAKKKLIKKIAKKKIVKVKKVIKKIVKKKVVSTAQRERDLSVQKVERLLQKGRGRGFITYAELLREFPTIETNLTLLDEIYEKFELAGIDVLEEGGLLDDVDTAKLLEKVGGSSLDSVQMYLKEIGKYKLIVAADERDLARRILQGDEIGVYSKR